MAKIIAVVNQKGGVGKTTTVINLGAGLAMLGKRVLLVDLDPQGNMSMGLGISAEESGKNVYYSLIAGESLSSNAIPTQINGMWVVPTDSNLAGAEVELVGQDQREFRLKKSIDQSVHENFDYVFFDCPPSLGLLTLNGLCAADSFLVPMQAEFFSLQGYANLLQTTNAIKENLNPALKQEGILITMYDSRSNFSKQVQNEIRAYAPELVFSSIIPRRVRLAESTSHAQPGIIYDANCYGAKSYLDLANEFLARERGERVEPKKIIPPDPVDRIGRRTQG